MRGIKIFYLYNSELSEVEASNKGYRSDIYIMKNFQYYHVNIYDITRLQQDFEAELKYYGFYGIEPNIIIVKEVTTINIKKTVEHLDKQNFFEKLLPVAKEYLKLDQLIEL